MRTTVLAIGFTLLMPSLVFGVDCVSCHRQTTPSIVTDWLASKHSGKGINCETCHGAEHVSDQDVHKAKRPLPETCGTCQAKQLQQFSKGKHSLAWAAVTRWA